MSDITQSLRSHLIAILARQADNPEKTVDEIMEVTGNKWISIKDKIPIPGQKVDLWMVQKNEGISYRMQWTWEKGDGVDTQINGHSITYWMPFPEKP